MIPNDNHNSWIEFINDRCVKCILKDIEEKIVTDYTPKNNVLRFLTTDLSKIKVVILGQDPYPQEGVATGRAFEIGDKKSWCEPIKQTSLINIIKSIYKTYHDEDVEKMDISQIREEIKVGKFKINRLIKDWFDNLEKQGVLFLNTAFTCEIDRPNSHSDIWKDFTEKLISHIVKKRPDCIWFIWGDDAENVVENYQTIKKIKCCHPRLYSFVNTNKSFAATQNTNQKSEVKINWLGTQSV